jgi:regulatory protein
LRDRLVRKGHDEATIEQTLDRCAEIGALNDRVLAATRARRFRDSGHAAFSTQQRLRRQGFADADTVAAIDEVYADFDEEAEARRLLAARPSTTASRSRAYGFLARRGFSPQVAGRLATELAGEAERTRAPTDGAELERQVRRRYPTAGSNTGARRRAAAFNSSLILHPPTPPRRRRIEDFIPPKSPCRSHGSVVSLRRHDFALPCSSSRLPHAPAFLPDPAHLHAPRSAVRFRRRADPPLQWTVALRLGGRSSLVARRAGRDFWRIPLRENPEERIPRNHA